MRLTRARAAVLVAGCLALAWGAAGWWAGLSPGRTQGPPRQAVPAPQPETAGEDPPAVGGAAGDGGDAPGASAGAPTSRRPAEARAQAATATAAEAATATAASSSERAEGGDPGAAYLEGRVVEASDLDRPLAGAIVEAGRDLDLPWRVVEAATVSAADGTYVVGPLAPREDEVRLVARSGGGRSQARRAHASEAGRSSGPTLVIAPGTIVCGRVLSPEGATVTSAAVVLRAGERQEGPAITGARGEFFFARVLPGDYTVVATDEVTGDAGVALVRVPWDSLPVEADVRLAPPAGVAVEARIAVVGPSGEPVAGAAVLCGRARDPWSIRVEQGVDAALAALARPAVARLAPAVRWLPAGASPRWSPPRGLLTGEDGSAEVRLPRAETFVVALAGPREGAPFGLGGAWAGAPSPDARRITLAVRPLGGVRGVVRDAPDGTTPSSGAVILAAAGRPGLEGREEEIAARRFAFDAVPAGEYLVGGKTDAVAMARVLAPARVAVREGEAAEVALAPGEGTEVLLRLDERGGAEDRLLSGVAVTRCEIGVVSIDPLPDGQARAKLAPGAYTLEVRGLTARGVRLACTTEFEVPAQREVTLTIPATGALRVRGPARLEARSRSLFALTSPARRVFVHQPDRPPAWREEGEDALLLSGVPAGRYALTLRGVAFDPPEVAIPEGGVAETTATAEGGE